MVVISKFKKIYFGGLPASPVGEVGDAAVEGGGTHSSSSAGSCSSQQDSKSITRSLLQQNNKYEIYLFVYLYYLELVLKVMIP